MTFFIVTQQDYLKVHSQLFFASWKSVTHMEMNNTLEK